MVNPAASNYQGEQFLVDLHDQARAAKRQEQLAIDPSYVRMEQRRRPLLRPLQPPVM
jgi:hypothetical protein